MENFDTDLFKNLTPPNLNILKKNIQSIESLDLSTISYEDLEIQLEKIFPIISFTSVIWDERYNIFRVRENINNSLQKPFNFISEIDLPKKVKSFGRANIINKPVFYGSHQGDLALFECCQNLAPLDIKNFTMGVWKVKKNQVLDLVILNPTKEIINKRESFKKLSHNINNNLKSLKEYDKEYSILTSSFFSKQFTKATIKQNDDYKISAYFSNYVQNIENWAQKKFDGIVYPSIANKFRGENIAIFESSLHKIEFVKALLISCYNFDYENGKLIKGIFAEGYQYGDTIHWKNK